MLEKQGLSENDLSSKRDRLIEVAKERTSKLDVIFGANHLHFVMTGISRKPQQADVSNMETDLEGLYWEFVTLNDLMNSVASA